MALRYAIATGNWSNPAIWDSGTVPVLTDDVRANGFTVTIDVDINVSQIATVALAPAVAGGTFSVITSRSITANINAGSTICLQSASGISVTIIGNINAGNGNAIDGVRFTNAGSILNVTGNVTAGSSVNVQYGINSSGTVNFIGNATGAAIGFGSAAININAGGVLNLTGIVTGGSAGNTSYGVQNAGNGTYSGTITGGSSGSSIGVRITAGVHTINSNCFGGNSNGSHGISVASSIATFNGNCTGGGFSGSHACNISSSTAMFNGNCTGGSTTGSNAVQISTSTATFNGSITGSAISSGALAVSVTDAASNVVISTMTFGSLGTVPVSGLIKFKNTAPTVTVLKANNTNQTLVDPSTTDIPVIGNVRNGITYASGSLTGTLNVPSPLTVALGVPTDNTVGSGVITIGDMGTLLASYNV